MRVNKEIIVGVKKRNHRKTSVQNVREEVIKEE